MVKRPSVPSNRPGGLGWNDVEGFLSSVPTAGRDIMGWEEVTQTDRLKAEKLREVDWMDVKIVLSKTERPKSGRYGNSGQGRGCI